MNKSPVRYRTAGGAVVTVTITDGMGRWECDGCGESPMFETSDRMTRKDGEDHADHCRALAG